MRDAASHYPLSESECVSLLSTPLITCIDRCPSPHNTTAHTSVASFMESSAFPGCGDAAVETQYDIISAQIDYAWAECRVKGNWGGERERWWELETVASSIWLVHTSSFDPQVQWTPAIGEKCYLSIIKFSKNSEMKEVAIWRKKHIHHSFFNKVLFLFDVFWQIS